MLTRKIIAYKIYSCITNFNFGSFNTNKILSILSTIYLSSLTFLFFLNFLLSDNDNSLKDSFKENVSIYFLVFDLFCKPIFPLVSISFFKDIFLLLLSFLINISFDFAK